MRAYTRTIRRHFILWAMARAMTGSTSGIVSDWEDSKGVGIVAMWHDFRKV